MRNLSEEEVKGRLQTIVDNSVQMWYSAVERPIVTTSHPDDHSVTYNISITVKEN